jgi:hypothetical protein
LATRGGSEEGMLTRKGSAHFVLSEGMGLRKGNYSGLMGQ